jgi:hypothetical protein
MADVKVRMGRREVGLGVVEPALDLALLMLDPFRLAPVLGRQRPS